MRITIHHSKYYDWEPVPADVQVTDVDVNAGLIKPSIDGKLVMRVSVEAPNGTHTSIGLPEEQIWQAILSNVTRGDRRLLTRTEAIGRYLGMQVFPHCLEPEWIEKIELDDVGAEEEAFRAFLAPHVTCGNLPQSKLEACVTNYLKDAGAPGLADDLETYFGVQKEES